MPQDPDGLYRVQAAVPPTKKERAPCVNLAPRHPYYAMNVDVPNSNSGFCYLMVSTGDGLPTSAKLPIWWLDWKSTREEPVLTTRVIYGANLTAAKLLVCGGCNGVRLRKAELTARPPPRIRTACTGCRPRCRRRKRDIQQKHQRTTRSPSQL